MLCWVLWPVSSFLTGSGLTTIQSRFHILERVSSLNIFRWFLLLHWFFSYYSLCQPSEAPSLSMPFSFSHPCISLLLHKLCPISLCAYALFLSLFLPISLDLPDEELSWQIHGCQIIYCGFKLGDQLPDVYLSTVLILFTFGIPACCGFLTQLPEVP